jgi:hypothetical protein
MAEKVKDIIEWLNNALDPDDLVGVDEGGVSIASVENSDTIYFEIGGIPEQGYIESTKSVEEKTISERREASTKRMKESHKKSKAKVLKEQELSELGPDQIMIGGEPWTIADMDYREISTGIYEINVHEEGASFILAIDSETAGKAARDRFEDMKNSDPEELKAMIGTDVLIAWALDQFAGPGEEKANSFSHWLEIVSEHPEEEFAHYDGEEQDIDGFGSGIPEELWQCNVAYRSN